MARFVKHSPCPKCGSKDNLGEYDDGSAWCFGCSYYRSKSLSSMVTKTEIRDTGMVHKPFPDDISVHFGPDAVSWAGKYGIEVETLIKRDVKYSALWNQLIFTFGSLWQARNLNKDSKRKYFTSGDHSDILAIYEGSGDSGYHPSDLVLVEDCLSAIKIAELIPLNRPVFDSMALLTSSIPSIKLNRLNRLYSRLWVWLDHDKGKEAMDICNRAQLLGLESKVIVTELDPKCYTLEEIDEKLR